MVWNVTNVPTAASGIKIECKPTEGGHFRVQTSEGWEICTIHGATPESIADGIASALSLVRDQGFEQGRQHVRTALGIAC